MDLFFKYERSLRGDLGVTEAQREACEAVRDETKEPLQEEGVAGWILDAKVAVVFAKRRMEMGRAPVSEKRDEAVIGGYGPSQEWHYMD